MENASDPKDSILPAWLCFLDRARRTKPICQTIECPVKHGTTVLSDRKEGERGPNTHTTQSDLRTGLSGWLLWQMKWQQWHGVCFCQSICVCVCPSMFARANVFPCICLHLSESFCMHEFPGKKKMYKGVCLCVLVCVCVCACASLKATALNWPGIVTGLYLPSLSLSLSLSYKHTHRSCYLPLFVPCPDGMRVFPLLFCPLWSPQSLWVGRSHMSQLNWPNSHLTACLSHSLSTYLSVCLTTFPPACPSTPFPHHDLKARNKISCMFVQCLCQLLNPRAISAQMHKIGLVFILHMSLLSQLSFAISLGFHLPNKQSHCPYPPYAACLSDHLPFWPS